MKRLLIGFAVVFLGLGLTFAQVPVPGECIYNAFPMECMDPVTPALCGDGCPGSAPLVHSTAGTSNGGGFDFAGTEFEACGHLAAGPLGRCAPFAYPTIHFWEFNNFVGANSGCQSQEPDSADPSGHWVINLENEFSIPGFPGVWVFFQTNFAGPDVDGCPLNNPRIAVAEFSFADSPREGTVNHQGFYAITSVTLTPPNYDFDNIRGAAGVAGNMVPISLIPSPLDVHSGPDNPVDAAYNDMDIMMPAMPSYYTENGTDDPSRPLIVGAVILYKEGTEPTSSWPDHYDGFASDPTSPDFTVPFIIPWGQPTIAAVPDNAAWFVTVLVYGDTSVDIGANEYVGSWATSDHVPISINDVEWGSYSAILTPDGVLLEWTTLMEVDTLGFVVEKSFEMDTGFSPIPGGIVEVRFPGFNYRFLDQNFTPGTRPYYRVIELTPDGRNDQTSTFTFEVIDREGRGLQRSRGVRHR